MKRTNEFNLAAKHLLNGYSDKVAFFHNYGEPPTWEGFTSGTVVSHVADHICEFHRVHFWGWSEKQLTAHMKKIYYDLVEDKVKEQETVFKR